MKKVTIIKKPVKSNALTVTAKELNELYKKHSYISIADKDFVEILQPALKTNPNKEIGVLCGDIEAILENKDYVDGDIPDVWFVNNEYFKDNYEYVGAENEK